MNKIKTTFFCLIMVCSICLVSLNGIVLAQQSGYEILDYEAETQPTIDGAWTNSFEWADAQEAQLDGNLDATFRIKYDSELITGDMIYSYFLIEFFDDTTNDADDYFQLCIAAAAEEGGEPTGGTTPQTECLRFDYVGHSADGFTFYRGDGSVWVEDSSAKWTTDILIVDSFDSSPLSATDHLIIEVRVAAAAFNINPEFWIRVAVFDDSNEAVGVQAWPVGSRDVPNDWGLVEIINDTIPEFSSWIILPLLVTATIAIIVGRKRLTKSGSLN